MTYELCFARFGVDKYTHFTVSIFFIVQLHNFISNSSFINKKQCIIYSGVLSMVMWYKKVQVILGLIKRENLIVLAVAKRE